MRATLILLLPQRDGADALWWRLVDGAVFESGGGSAFAPVDRVIALAPATQAPVRWFHFADLAVPQAMAAARLEAMDYILGSAPDYHVVAGAPTADGWVPTTAVKRNMMALWSGWLQSAGIEANAMVPIAAAMPRPDEAEACRAVIGEQVMLAAAGLVAASDPAIDPLRVGTAPLVEADTAMVTRWLESLDDPIPLDLLTGDYAPRLPSGWTPGLRRWTLRLAAVLAGLTMAVPLAQQWQWSRAVAAADAAALAAAAKAGVKAEDIQAVEVELDRRLAARGGGPLAMTAPLGGLYRALQSNPAVSVRTLNHAGNGTLAVTLASPRIDDVNAVLKDLQARAFIVTGQPLSGSDGMQMAAITIRAVP